MKVLLSLTLLVGLTLAEPPRYRQQHQSDRNQYYFARQQQEVESPPEPEAAAPYPASGWKPDGPAFELPQRQQQQNAAPAPPQQQYGAPQAAPQNQYGAPQAAPPQKQYGAPQAAPQQQYRGPAAPQRQYAAPSAPQQQYGAPAPQGQYGPPAAPQQGYGAPEAVTTTEAPNAPDFEDSTALPESQAEPVDSVNELDEEGEVDEQQRQSGEYYVALPDGRLQRVQYMSSQDVEAMKYFAKIRAENVEPLRGPIYAYAPLQKLEFAPARLQVAIADPYAATPVVAIRENAPNAPRKNAKAAPEKLQQSRQQQQQRQPLAAEVRYESPAAVVGLAGAPPAPVSSSYTTYTANYQVPAEEQRYIVTF